MTGPRIADAPSAGGGPAASAPAPTPPGALTLLGERITSPIGVMIVVPLLVGVVGLFLTFVGQRALSASNLEVASARLREQAELVAVSVSDALLQADPMLDRLVELAEAHDSQRPIEPIAHALAGLMRGRAGVTYTSLSFPDGTFQGAYVDDDGVLRFQVSRVVDAATTRVWRYHLGPHGSLVLQREETTSYDPRKRAFYQLAVERAARAWTEPYPFYGTHHTGITRVAPVYLGQGDAARLHAVATVDFDVHGLSSQLGRHRFEGTQALLFARDGAVLAYAADAGSAAPSVSKDRVLTYRDLKSPVIDAVFSAVPEARRMQAGNRVVEASGTRHMVALAPITGELALPWTMAYLAPEEFFLHGLFAHRRFSMLVAGLGLLTSLIVAFVFARSITRVRAEAASARADAAAARERARDLGSYRLVSCLGKGAMGEVWRAEHRLLARQAAIKLINPALHDKDSAEVRGRFRREAETLAKLRSRNTIELFDYGVSEDGTFFFVMELLDGMDLDTLVTRHGPQPVQRVVHLLLQACSSLAEAHDRGLVHRDIKPANLFICRAADEVDVVKVLDFGLVLSDATEAIQVPRTASAANALLAAGKLTQPGGLMGTPAFMPPEQAAGEALDGRADLYALACVAVWLLSGEQVYQQDNPMQLLVAHLSEPVPDLRARLPPSVPDALVRLLTRCLQKQPSQRPDGVREFARALRALELPEQWTADTARAWWDQHHPQGAAAGASADAEITSAPTLLSLHE